LCWNPVELAKRIRMAFVKWRYGPAPGAESYRRRGNKRFVRCEECKCGVWIWPDPGINFKRDFCDRPQCPYAFESGFSPEYLKECRGTIAAALSGTLWPHAPAENEVSNAPG